MPKRNSGKHQDVTPRSVRRRMSPAAYRLIEERVAQGFRLVRAHGQHMQLRAPDGTVLWTAPFSARGGRRSLQNSLADLRRALRAYDAANPNPNPKS